MSKAVQYVFFVLILLNSSFTSYCQKEIVFPITIVIFSGIDTIYCFEDSLSEMSDLIPINTEKDYLEFVNDKLESIKNIDTVLYQPMIRFNAIFSEKFGQDILPWERVFDYDGKSKRKIGFFYRNEIEEPENYYILKEIIRKRLNK